MGYFVGVDIGSLGTKSVIIDEDNNIVGKSIIPTGARVADSYQQGVADAIKSTGLDLNREDLLFTVATGYGRKRAQAVGGVDAQVTEITCHAKGACHFFPGTRTILDIGGQDTKGIRITESGDVENFVMNDKCAAGTGRFLEVMARALEVDLDDLGALSMESDQPTEISSFCTVFGESEVISHVANGVEVKNIIHGLHDSISGRAVGILKRVGIESEVTMSGGVSRNIGMRNEIEKKLGQIMNVSEDSQIIGALGAALIARQRYQSNG